MILRLDDDRRDETVDVLGEAFRDYPAMRFMLGKGDAYARRLAILIGSYVDSRLGRGAPVLGIERAGALAAVALVDEPARPSLPEAFDHAGGAVRAALGEAAWRRIEAFENAVTELEPDEPHHYIGMLGVRDRHRGNRLAGQLVDEVLRMSVDDPVSRSVCLSTESAENLTFYAHLGFTLVGEVRVGDLRSWTLRHPGV